MARFISFISAFLLCHASIAGQLETTVLSKSDTLSDILFAQGLKPIYGQGNFLEQTLALNGITLLEAKSLPIGKTVLLPIKAKKTLKAVKQAPLLKEQAPRPVFNGFIRLGNSSIEYLDNLGNKAILDAPINAQVGMSYKSFFNSNWSLTGMVAYDYLKLRSPKEIALSDDVFSSWSLLAIAHYKANSFTFGMGYGNEMWVSPTLAEGTNLELDQSMASYLRPSIGTESLGLRGSLFARSYLPRNSGSFKMKGGTFYGVEIFFPNSWTEASFIYETGTRETELIEEKLSTFSLKIAN